MASLLAPITLLTEFLAAVAVAFSIAVPTHRIWPPPRPGAWQSWAMWLLFATSAAGVVAVGILDWGAWGLAPSIRWAVGGPLWLAGNVIAVWGMGALGLARTHGGAGALVRRGPYRFSRNPQYVGFIAGLIGWPLVSGSLLALPVAWAGVVACALAPWAEESWLSERYGARYEIYRRSVSRFLGLPARPVRAPGLGDAKAQRIGKLGKESQGGAKTRLRTSAQVPVDSGVSPPSETPSSGSGEAHQTTEPPYLLPREMRTVELARDAGGATSAVRATIDDNGALRVFRTASMPGACETEATATVAAEDLDRLLDALLLDASRPRATDGLSRADRDALLLRLVKQTWGGDTRAVETFTAFARVRGIEVDRFGWL